ncbi:hypothetical protein A2982_03435 [candidate division WWE3 bacterium RIFCSPLOWO2_01_FULL_39_13]|uniref:SpoVT-AbrB domain-containing protein n=1 Tax=candidate division WWE3 bacterium RIFCSPLOWO2_01_FULL_39_13 TaxID=1802624 RepID=A0A1F4V385_UNCKA|nr:MAG: hypothetical protein A2982_03435 [candidate division WWE3 bacterium RIFCSPLOWO2_01_FULL_39_13]
MTYVTTVTQKGQITLPKTIRDNLGIKIYDKVKIEAFGKNIKVVPTHDILDIAGKFKSKGNKSILLARESLEKNYERV